MNPPDSHAPDLPPAPSFTARITPGGQQFDAPADATLLHSAEAGGVAGLPSSCRNGTCRTCICLLASGQVTYRIAWPGVSYDEKREGFILPCVAYPLSDVTLELPF